LESTKNPPLFSMVFSGLAIFSAKKRQGWERRERRKRDNPSPVKMLIQV
jgi:hypothetical protein